MQYLQYMSEPFCYMSAIVSTYMEGAIACIHHDGDERKVEVEFHPGPRFSNIGESRG